jgi:response regulator RpfG family c-di-GMP phosphodiesterase
MDANPIILIVGATRKESIHIEKCLIDWKYEAVSLDEETSGIAAPLPKSPILMLVYAQEGQKDTIAICEQLRKDPEGATAPILLVIGKYKMSKFYELRRHMENITAIVTPFDQEKIQTGIDKIIGTT